MNNAKNKTPMATLDPKMRCTHFEEVALGYTEEEARAEAARCLHCAHKPCVSGCPVGVDIPSFIEQIAQGEVDKAYLTITQTNALPAVCGRVCPQEKQCESRCVRAIKGESVAIGRLERFAADRALSERSSAPTPPPSNGHRVAVIGAGPAGLTCAGTLAASGFDVTVFESLHVPGGVLMYGIPAFRLPKPIVSAEIQRLTDLGVKLVTNAVAGNAFTLDSLFTEGFEAVFIGTGAGLPAFASIPGESLCGVLSANEFLTRVNLMHAAEESYDTPLPNTADTVVVGGGNVAMDAARCARRLGANVTLLYRRTRAEMPARAEEIEHALEEGIRLRELAAPLEVLGENGTVRGIRCTEMELTEPDESGRRRPIPKENSEFVLKADCVIMALGTSPNPLLTSRTPGLVLNARGCIQTDENGATSLPHIYAGGDAVTGAATVIQAMGAGRQAAHAIEKELLK